MKTFIQISAASVILAAISFGSVFAVAHIVKMVQL